MQLIADLWWIWGAALLGSIAYLITSMFGRIKNPASMLDGNMKSAFMAFLPVWAFGALFVLSIILNIIDYIKA